jgi:hypothetical protein
VGTVSLSAKGLCALMWGLSWPQFRMTWESCSDLNFLQYQFFHNLRNGAPYLFICLLFFGSTGVWLRASHLLGRLSTTILLCFIEAQYNKIHFLLRVQFDTFWYLQAVTW